MADQPLYAEVGRLGLVVPLAEFRARLGGEPALRRVLAALTVTEKAHPGRPRGMARATRKAYATVRVRGAEYLVLPRIKGPPFLRARARDGRPLLDEIRAAPPGGGRLAENAPLPAPRALAPERCAPGEPLYEYQEAAVAHLCGPGGPLSEARRAAHQGVAYLEMGTGLGKTRIALGVIVRLGMPALFVVPTGAIGEQCVEEARELYPDLEVGFYHNAPRNSRQAPPGPRTHDVVLVIVNTFRDKGPAFLEGYGTVVYDEAHEYHSPCNSRVLWLGQARAVLGLSATPEERPDGLDRYVHLHLGPVVVATAIPGFDLRDVSFRGEARVVEYAGHPDHCETATTPAGTMSAILTIGNIVEDPARLRLVAAEVERLLRLHETEQDPDELLRLGLGPRPAACASPGHPAGEVRRHGVFVFAELREYLPALRGALLERLRPAEVFAPELGPAEAGPAEAGPGAARGAGRGAGARRPAPQVSVLRGGAAKTAVSDARRAGAHVVLTTYGFSRRGISLPDMTAIVLATPRRNGSRQILGRIARRGSDESILRQVVDVLDVRTGLRGQLADRRKVYAEKAYPVARVAASWEEFAEAPAGGPAPAPDRAPAEAPDGGLEGMTLDDLLAAALGQDFGPAPAFDVDDVLNG